MGLILDSSVLIAGERRGESVWEILERIRTKEGETKSALSVISVLELTHGIYRAKTDKGRQRRLEFVEELCHAVPGSSSTIGNCKTCWQNRGRTIIARYQHRDSRFTNRRNRATP